MKKRCYMKNLQLISACVLVLFMSLLPAGCNTNTQNEDSDPADNTSSVEAAPYKKGTVTRTRFQSEYLQMGFAVPNGYIMATETELDKMTEFSSEPVYVEGSTTLLDYTKADIVCEMQVTASSNSPIVSVSVEKLLRNSMTEEEYLDSLKSHLTSRVALTDMKALNYTVRDAITPVNVGGRQCKQLTATAKVQGRELFQDVIVSKCDDRMLIITVSYDANTKKQMESLMVNFTALSDLDSSDSNDDIDTSDTSNSNGSTRSNSTPNYPSTWPWQ
ncbi:MAG: DUF1795 domain-containing protein [Peptococcaceae bacterium]|nr:DUF1795 domain-containing protein [Peptococcaceae bacterium]